LFYNKLVVVEARSEGPKLFKHAVIYINKATSKGNFAEHSNNRRSRQSDLLFLAFHKEKPSPIEATVRLLLQQVFIFHDLYMPNMSYSACCNVPYLLQRPKKCP